MTPAIRVLAADDQRVVREGIAMILSLLPGVEVVGTAADGQEVLALARERRPDVVLMDLRMPRLDGVEATRRLRAEFPRIKVIALTTYADDRSVMTALRAGAVGYLTKDAGAEEIRQALQRVASGQAVIDPAVQRHLVEAIALTPAPPGEAPVSAEAPATGEAPGSGEGQVPAEAPASAEAPATGEAPGSGEGQVPAEAPAPAGAPAPGEAPASAEAPAPRETPASAQASAPGEASVVPPSAASQSPAVPSPPSAACPRLPGGLTPREAEVLELIAAGESNAEIAARLVVTEATVKSHINHMLPKIGARDRAQAVRYAYQHGLAR